MKKLVVFAFFLPALTNASILNLPLCDASNIQETLADVFKLRGDETGIDLTPKSIDFVKEVKFPNQGKDVRACSAIVQANIYKFDTIYSISPYEKGFWVQLEDAQIIMDQETLSKGKSQFSNSLAEDKLKSFELAKKHGNMSEACTSLRVAKQFYLDANNEDGYIKVSDLLKENNCK
ncbi:hypothetical protein [Avibacterium sp. 20-129]|uniref:hypothetical protein n=1 Tax=Avibacterium sp. 20-129 TaxID=2911525 RepID=UPI002246CCAE|nr:hypothetical protein [Avibacterium sp. 20-129]MCW9699737.1 hypothetical protein [Avibacterium sp. 20-129]